MRRYSINCALFLVMERGEKLTYEAIWSERLGPHNRYVLWPRGEYWDVRFKRVVDMELVWEPIADKPFTDENEAWQAAFQDWDKRQNSRWTSRK